MQSNIEEVVSQYLTMPTNYAILINSSFAGVISKYSDSKIVIH